MALFPFDVAMDEAIPQGYGLEGLREQGLLFEGASTPFEVTAMGLDLLGAPLVRAMESHRRLLTFGFNIRDESRGAVRYGPKGEPLVTYNLGKRDVAQLRFGLRVLVDLLVRGGADVVYPPVWWAPIVRASVGSRALDARTLHAGDLALTAYHPLGTARMGMEAASSVVDMDLRVRGLKNVLVCDGSVLPSSIGSNPQVTIMALAARAAERLADRLA
ncbi:MAG: GMC family oxidoreductase [Myxococcales bacterium]